jgi:amidohydrolase
MPVPDIDEETRRWTIDARRRLHRNPHPTGEEADTQRMLFGMLEELGIEARPMGGYGVVAEIEGSRPGRTVALRADMDALRITEVATDRNAGYISSNEGVMHACGHDGHMAMVLGAARVLNGIGDSLKGTVRMLFQPHEEAHPGGAVPMIEEGAIEDVDAIFGFHIMGYLPSGQVAFRAGDLMAHINTFELTITGRSGHHMDPDQCIDPIVMAARFIGSIERDVANELDPTHPWVLGFGEVHGGTQFNQTPDEVVLKGTFRTFDQEDSETIQWVMDRTLQGLVEVFAKDEDGEVPNFELELVDGYPVLRNDPELASRAAEVLREEGLDVEPFTRLNFGAEDFAYYAQEVPALFMFLGTNNPEKGITAVNHSSRFDIDEDVLEVGVRTLLALTLDILEEE